MKAVIFDKDGVLVETFYLYYRAYKKIFSELGINITRNDIAKRYGMKGAEIIKQIMNERRINIKEKQLKELTNKKDRLYYEMAEKKLELLPGVIKLLIYLKNKNYKIGIASSASKEIIEQLLRVMKIKKYFDATISGLEVNSSKPHPEIFLECAKRLKVKPEECIVIEDSVHGIEAAKRAGMKCIAVATGQHSREELQKMKPDLLLNTLKEFNKIEWL